MNRTSIARRLRKAADLIDTPAAWEARRLRIPLPLYLFFERVRLLFPIKTIIDVGANRGDFTCYVLQRFPGAAIHAFEPLPSCRPMLEKIASANPAVHYHPVALGETAGPVQMQVNAYDPSSSMLPIRPRHWEMSPKTRETRPATVEMDTLDRMEEEIHFEPPVLLKLDVQGYEMKILMNAEKTLAKTSVLLTEVLFEPLYEGQTDFAALVRLLDERGLRFMEFVETRRFPPLGTLAYADAAFARVSDEARRTVPLTPAPR